MQAVATLSRDHRFHSAALTPEVQQWHALCNFVGYVGSGWMLHGKSVERADFNAMHLHAACQAGLLRVSDGNVLVTNAGVRRFLSEQYKRRFPHIEFDFNYGVLLRCLPKALRMAAGKQGVINLPYDGALKGPISGELIRALTSLEFKSMKLAPGRWVFSGLCLDTFDPVNMLAAARSLGIDAKSPAVRESKISRDADTGKAWPVLAIISSRNMMRSPEVEFPGGEIIFEQ